ncbi:MAG: hypothetical protein FJX54_20685 [Alphaproteobacteria bacterium]|nr:hypothetical protein [Alphaproteobacteria bacterium]
MFLFRSKTYEIQASRKGRWTIEQTSTDQADAEVAAKALLNKLKDIEAIRVVLDGRSEKVLFEQKKPQTKNPIVVPQIEEAPVCSNPDDLYGPQSRKIVNRLFRQYLDRAMLTPTEIMHSGREMKRVMDFESIVQTAIARVASVQKDSEGGDAKKRTDALWSMVNGISKRATEADKLKLPSIRELGFDEAVKFVTKAAKPEELKFTLRCVFSRELSQTRSWYGKLTQVLEWSNTSRESAGLVLLDDFISDTLASGTLIADILGNQPNLAAALIKLLDIADGEYKPGRSQSPDMAGMEEMLCKLMKTGRLPASRDILLERVRSELRGTNPLSKNDANAEIERFCEIIDRVLLDRGVAGGTGMAEALVHRATVILNVGGANGQREGVVWVLRRGPWLTANAHFLISIMNGRMAAALDDVPATKLEALIGGIHDVAEIAGNAGSPMDHMRSVTNLYRAIEICIGLPPESAKAICAKLDELLHDYVVKGRIVEQMDNPGWKLHTRAFLLMQMCMPDVLPNGKAIMIARKAVVNHLRRPNFEVELVSGVTDPEEQKKIILQCHHLMKAGGFR